MIIISKYYCRFSNENKSAFSASLSGAKSTRQTSWWAMSTWFCMQALVSSAVVSQETPSCICEEHKETEEPEATWSVQNPMHQNNFSLPTFSKGIKLFFHTDDQVNPNTGIYLLQNVFINNRSSLFSSTTDAVTLSSVKMPSKERMLSNSLMDASTLVASIKPQYSQTTVYILLIIFYLLHQTSTQHSWITVVIL